MASLNDLLQIDGVCAAGEFSADGNLVDHKANGEMSRDQGELYAGGDWTVAIGGNRGVFVEMAIAGFNKFYGALVGGR